MISPVIYAAAYLLLTAHAPANPDVVRPVAQPQAMPQNHLTIRWIGERHYHHRHHRR